MKSKSRRFIENLGQLQIVLKAIRIVNLKKLMFLGLGLNPFRLAMKRVFRVKFAT